MLGSGHRVHAFGGTVDSPFFFNSDNKTKKIKRSKGVKDFFLGVEILYELEKLADFPFLSANIKDKNGKLLFKPYIVEEINGVRVGIVGLTSKFVNNELIIVVMGMFGAVFSGLQLFQIKRIADLCERVTRMETEIEHHFNGKHDEPKTRRFP